MKLTEQGSIRILHVVGGMNRGGTETWLMHILRHIDRDRFQMDFLVHTTQPCAYDDEIRSLGSKIIPCLEPSQPRLYARNLKRILREYGPYDVIHSHVHHFSGYVLRLAKQVGVPARIAHSHNDTSSIETRLRLYRHLYLALMKRWVARYSTVGLAASRKAAVNLFDPTWETDPRLRILYCCIDPTQFQQHVDSVAVRAEFGIPTDAFVIGHVGRFDEQKNHVFLVDIAVKVIQQEPRTYLLLVGDGSLRQNIEQKVAQLGLVDRVIFAGGRSDVPRLMLGAMDIFLLPSLHEGLPLVLLEAQAAGLTCIFSDIVTEEVDVLKPLLRRISLSQSVSGWTKAVVEALGDTSVITQKDALAVVEKSPFNIDIGIKKLTKIYDANFSIC